MPDISMCQNEQCSQKCNCYRFTCDPSQFMQAYADFTPLQDDENGFTCEYFWPILKDTYTLPKN